MENFDFKKYIAEGILLKENTLSPEIEKAIQDIVTYATLPSQIDYRRPWKTKADKAEEFLQSLPDGENYLNQAREQIDAYYTPNPESGMSPSDYDEMFENTNKTRFGNSK
jgi:hypothetical protein